MQKNDAHTHANKSKKLRTKTKRGFLLKTNHRMKIFNELVFAFKSILNFFTERNRLGHESRRLLIALEFYFSIGLLPNYFRLNRFRCDHILLNESLSNDFVLRLIHVL